MHRLEREEFLSDPFILLWSILGFQAGFINSFGFLACGRYVSHVTGVGTQIGIAVGESNHWLALELLGFPLSFMLGAFFSGVFTSARLERSLKPRYDLMTLFLPLIILAVGILGWKGMFGDFGEALREPRDFILLFSLSFACGLQNGCFATLTKGQIRTTHLTGISTDIGTDFARLICGKLSGAEKRLVIRANISRIATFVSFSSGSILSVLATEHVHYAALIIPFFTALGVSVLVLLAQQAIADAIAKTRV